MLLLMSSVLCGCGVLHDDLSKCDLFLKFRYDYNMSYEDWFPSQVEEVKVFVFDKEGKYVQTFTESGEALKTAGYRMNIPYHMKGHTLVVWAGRTDADYVLPQLAAGDPINKLTLCYEPQSGTSNRKIAPLWYSGTAEMIFPEEGETVQDVSLIRNTNDFNIGISGQGGTFKPVSDFDIRIKGANGSYDCHNNCPAEIADITYTPAGYDGEQTAHLYTMRLIKGASMLLSVTEKSTGKEILIGGKAQADLIDLLLKSKPENMGEQEYLDRKYIWDLSFSYDTATYMAVSVTINGWTYWFHNTDL